MLASRRLSWKVRALPISETMSQRIGNHQRPCIVQTWRQ